MAAKLQRVSVKDFTKFVFSARNYLFIKREILANVCFHSFTIIGWIKLLDVSFGFFVPVWFCSLSSM